MTPEQLALIVLVTKKLKAKGYRYLAEIKDKEIVIRIFKGRDEA